MCVNDSRHGEAASVTLDTVELLAHSRRRHGRRRCIHMHDHGLITCRSLRGPSLFAQPAQSISVMRSQFAEKSWAFSRHAPANVMIMTKHEQGKPKTLLSDLAEGLGYKRGGKMAFSLPRLASTPLLLRLSDFCQDT